MAKDISEWKSIETLLADEDLKLQDMFHVVRDKFDNLIGLTIYKNVATIINKERN